MLLGFLVLRIRLALMSRLIRTFFDDFASCFKTKTLIEIKDVMKENKANVIKIIYNY